MLSWCFYLVSFVLGRVDRGLHMPEIATKAFKQNNSHLRSLSKPHRQCYCQVNINSKSRSSVCKYERRLACSTFVLTTFDLSSRHGVEKLSDFDGRTFHYQLMIQM